MPWLGYSFIQRVYGIQSLVAVKERANAVKIISAAFGNDIYDGTRRLSEFRFIAGKSAPETPQSSPD